MAAQVPLLTYLQHGPALIPLDPPARSSSNTRNTAYSHRDIRSMSAWPDFTLATIMQRYGQVLTTVAVDNQAMPGSPPGSITSESVLKTQINEYIMPRIRRSLRVTFQQQGQFANLHGLTPVLFGPGDKSVIIDRFRPDTAYFDPARRSPPNRAPGDIKPSWKWNTAQAQGRRYAVEQHKQVFAQVNFYMRQHRTRYGFILTDRELVVFRRIDANGNLQVAAPIPWNATGNLQAPRLTVCLALWYLGILAAHDNGLNNHAL